MTRRGPEPSDPRHFRQDVVPTLRTATADLSWLLGRGYAEQAALKLVGDRFQLAKRQRHAVVRAACTDAERDQRAASRVSVSNQPVVIDGFNTLIVLERALAGGPVFVGRDGAIRDIGGVHGTYRTVEHTPRAVHLLAGWLERHGASEVRLLLDRPVSNSGKLAGLIREAVPAWTVDVEDRVDPLLVDAEAVVCSADAWVLDHCSRWANVLQELLAEELPDAWVVDLG